MVPPGRRRGREVVKNLIRRSVWMGCYIREEFGRKGWGGGGAKEGLTLVVSYLAIYVFGFAAYVGEVEDYF